MFHSGHCTGWDGNGPKIDTSKFTEWYEDLFDELDLQYEEEINKLIKEAEQHVIDCKEGNFRLIKKHP